MRKTLINLRGTNGSGKSTLARRFFGEFDATVDLAPYTTKTGKTKWATGRVNPENLSCVVGDYSTMAGGLDKLPTFAVQFQAIEAALALPDASVVVAEGVLASTVLGSWAGHARQLIAAGHDVLWAFMSTPVSVCLERIQARNGGKPIKEDLVRGKWEQIDRVRQKARLIPGLRVMSLPFGGEWEALQQAI